MSISLMFQFLDGIVSLNSSDSVVTLVNAEAGVGGKELFCCPIRELVDTNCVALVPHIIEVLNEFQVFLEHFKPHFFLGFILVNSRELSHPLLVVINNGLLVQSDMRSGLRDPKIHGKNG